jgi:hypothetical protein
MREDTLQPYDAFISYRHASPDQEWVKGRLVPSLRQHRLRVWLDINAIVPGGSLLTQMEQGVLQSRYVIAILTPAYLQGLFALLEKTMAEQLSREGQVPRLLLVLRESCTASQDFKSYRLFDMRNDINFEASVLSLAEALRE